MYVVVGDWLIVSGGAHGYTEHRAKIIEVLFVDGLFLYCVYWIEDDYEALVFFGLDVCVVFVGDLAEYDRQLVEWAVAV